MADTYEPGQDRRGNSRQKRRRDENDDYHYSPRDNFRQRRRDDNHTPRRGDRLESAPVKLRRMLLHIASSSTLPETEAVSIAKAASVHYDTEDVREEFFETIISLILEQPFKIPYVAAVVLYGNQLQAEIAADIIKRVGDRLQEALGAGEWKEFKLVLRFLACLQPLYEGNDGVFALLSHLFDTVIDLQTENESDVVGIELTKIVLLTIPYAIASGGERFHEKAKELLTNTAIVVGNTQKMERFIHAYDDESDDKVFDYYSAIGVLQSQLTIEAENGWPLSCIPRFDIDAISKQDSEDMMSQDKPTHAFPAYKIPSPVNPGPKPLFPEAYFSLFADQEMATVPKTTDIAASIIRDTIVDTIDQLDFNREAVAKFLIEIDCYWPAKTFVQRGTGFEKFRESVGDKVMYKPEDIIIDAIFSILFKLPTPERKLVYYHSVLTTCCQIAPVYIAPSLGRAIRTVFKGIGALDLELAYRFLDWFSHHLSNFDFRWRWTEWIPESELDDLYPPKAFILAVLHKEIRLSFARRVRSTLPEPMQGLVADVNTDSSPDFKFADPTAQYHAEGTAVIKLIKDKANSDEMQATFDSIHAQAQEQGVDPLVVSTDVFVTAICRVGAKSLSHVFSCIERTKTRLMNIAESSEAARRQIITSVIEYWKDSHGTAVRIIDVLINYSILAPLTVVQWAFMDYVGAGEALSESWIFEMITNTVAKVCNRNRQIASARIQKHLSQAQLAVVNGTLEGERGSARDLFQYILNSLQGYVDGTADKLVEKKASGALTAEQSSLIQAWAKRWHLVFERKVAVEESIIGEEAIEARLKVLESQPDVPAGIEAAAANGTAEENVAAQDNGDAEML